MTYHKWIMNNRAPQEQYMDDFDLYQLLRRYHHGLKEAKIHIHHLQKITKKSETTDDFPTQLHREADSLARNRRLVDRMQHPIQYFQDWPHLIDISGIVTGNEKFLLAHQWSTYRVEQYYTQRWQCTYDQLK